MATVTGFLIPDYDGTIQTAPAGSAAYVGTVASGASTGVIITGLNRLFQLWVCRQTTPSNANEKFVLRYTMGNSKTGHAAPTPTSSSPFLTSDNLVVLDTGNAYDSINLANLVADNSAILLAYSVSFMAKF